MTTPARFLTIRNLSFVFIVAALILPTPVVAEKSKAGADTIFGPVELNQNVTVDGPTVLLGDLFTNTGDKQTIPVAYAPRPGNRARYDATWLYRVARAYKLNWRPISTKVQSTIQRESLMVAKSDIIDALLVALIDNGADADMEIELSGRTGTIYVAAGPVPELIIEDLVYKQKSRRFSAVLAATVPGAGTERYRLTGRLNKVTEIPVFNRRILAKEIIGERDIIWKRVRADRLPRDTVMNLETLIGKTPLRGIKAGVPVRQSIVSSPILTPKGSLVTIILKLPRMTLTAKGKALQNGSEGDVIRVENKESKTVIEAEVIGSGKVAVQILSQVAASN